MILATLFISALFAVALGCLLGALRHTKASKALDVFMHQFNELADDNRVPLSILETIHKMFETACHPCAVVIAASGIVRYRMNPEFRREIDKQRVPEIDDLDPEVRSKVAKTFVKLYIYASYALPVFGMFARLLIDRLDQRPADQRKTKFLATSAAHAPPRHTRFSHAVTGIR